MRTIKSAPVYVISALLVAVVITLYLTEISPAATADPVPEVLRGILVEKPSQIPQFKLTDHHNKIFSREKFRGKWTFLFFGYTHCPDICPATLTELDNAANRFNGFKPASGALQYMFVSVDPKRDTPKELAQYIDYFGAEFIGATGSEKELRSLTKTLDINFKYDYVTESEYFVNHSSAMLLIDPQARYYARLRAPHYSDDIVDFSRLVIKYYEEHK